MDDATIRLIIIGSCVLFFSFLAFIIYFILAQKKKRDKALSKLGSKRNGTGEYEGMQYLYRFYPGTRNAPSFFRVEIVCPSNRRFKIRKESRFDRLAKVMGIACEVDTGDPAFDADYYISTDDVQFTRELFTAAEKRQAVRTIMESGFTHVELDGGKIRALCSPFKISREIDKELLHAIAHNLLLLAQELPHVVKTNPLEKPAWKKKRMVAFALPILFAVVAVPAFIFGITRYKPLDTFGIFLDSLKYTIPALFMYLVLAFFLLKGRSTSHREFLIFAVIALNVFIAGGWGVEIFLNGYLDTSQPSSHNSSVRWKSKHTSDNSTTHYAHVASWRLPGQSEKIQVSPDVYYAIAERKSSLEITTRDGGLGFEWLVDCRLAH